MVVSISLLILEGGARLMALGERDEADGFPTAAPSLDAYLGRLEARLGQELPPAAKNLVRVPAGTPGSQVCEATHVLPVEPGRLPRDQRRLLIFGGSAAHGWGVKYRATFGHLVESTLRRELADQRIKVLNFGHPGWDLKASVVLMRRVVQGLDARPETVIIYSGNNEFYEAWRPPRIGTRPWEMMHLYGRLTRWLFPVKEIQPMEDPAGARVLEFIWLPGGGLQDASFWASERKLIQRRYRTTLSSAVAWLRQRGIHVVLVPPPVNLDFFPGSMLPQPLTYRAVGRAGHRTLERKLRDILSPTSGAPRLKHLSRFVEQEPSGPLQQWALGRMLDRAGLHDRAMSHLARARDQMWGYGAAIPTLGSIVRAQAGEGISVIDTRQMYATGRSVGEQADRLFEDACHLTKRGHELLANRIAKVLLTRR